MIEQQVLPGDVIHTASQRKLSRLIRWATSDRGKKAKAKGHLAKAVVNHTGLVVEAAESIHKALIIEAVGEIRKVVVEKVYEPQEHVTVWRPLNIPHSEIQEIIALAEADLGEKYPYMQLVPHLLDSLIPGRPMVFRRFAGMSGRFVCSASLGVWFAKRGRTFGAINAATLSPDDILDYQVSTPKHWGCVRPLQPLGSVV